MYFLFCKEENDSDSVYIGESESIHDRLLQHLRDYTSDNENFYWTTAVIFLGRDLNKALIRYLEDRFVQITRDNKRYKVLTKKTYGKTIMKESQTAAMEEFIDNVKVLINALGYKVLEPTVQTLPESTYAEKTFYLHMGNANASGVVTTEDIIFSSSSAAAVFVTGYSISGPANWKNKNGITLKEIESKDST